MTFRNESFLQALRRFELLAGASEPTLCALAAHVAARRVARGVCLWRTGLTAEQVVFVRSGYVAMRGSSGGAGRVVFAFAGPNDVSGAEFSLRWGVYTSAAFVASARADLLLIEGAVLAKAAKGDAALARALEGAAARGPDAFESKLRVFCAGGSARRLATSVVNVAARYGARAAGGAVTVQNAPALSDFAAFAGVPLGVATKHFVDWSTQGLVRFHENDLLVEAMPGLEAIARGDEAAVECRPSRSSGVICRPGARPAPAQLRALRRG